MSRRTLSVALLAMALPVIATPASNPPEDVQARTLVLGIQVDRDGARLISYTLKPTPFVPTPLPPPRYSKSGSPAQLEVRMLGPDGTAITKRRDTKICLEHEPTDPPHIMGDTILPHRDALLISMPERVGFDRLEFATYSNEKSGTRRRVLGRDRFDAVRFDPAGSSFTAADLRLGEIEDGFAESSPADEDTATVLWPQTFDDPDILREYRYVPDSHQRMQVVIVPDGYTYEMKSKMELDAAGLVTHLGLLSPFMEHDSLIRYTLVYAYSLQNGVDECDCGIVRDTAMGVQFPDRDACLSPANRCASLNSGSGCGTSALDNVMAAEFRAPFADENMQTVILANSSRYGGCAGTRAVYTSGAGSHVGVHELGHSFADLSDEYVSVDACGTSAQEINTSTDSQFGAWPEWRDELGLPHEGAGHYATCVFRPEVNCRMRSNSAPFCRVCTQQIDLELFGHPRVAPTAPIESSTPGSTVHTVSGTSVDFAVATRFASGTGVVNAINWTVQGPDDPEPVQLASGLPAFTSAFGAPGRYEVRCTAIADMDAIKPVKYDANVDVVSWEVLVDLHVVDSDDDGSDEMPGDAICATAGGGCTLRAAIEESNAHPGRQIIELPPGFYQADAPAGAAGGGTGPFEITDDLTLLGSGAGATVIDGGGGPRTLSVLDPAVVEIRDVTIANGLGHPFGGGVYNSGGTVLLGDVLVAANSTGIVNASGMLHLEHSTVSGNTATGVFNKDSGTMHIDSSSIVDNTASEGAGVAAAGPVTIINSTIAGNSATGSGGGLLVDGEPPTIVNTTITENSAASGGGIFAYQGPILHNVIVAGNSTDCVGFDDPVSLGHNLFGDPGDCADGLGPDDFVGDPLLTPRADTGVPGGIHYPLEPTSPAIDAADPFVCPAVDQIGRPRRDGDGDGTTVCDSGSVEAAQGPYTVDSLADVGDAVDDGGCATVGGFCSLRAAIQEANRLSDPNTIFLPAGTYSLSLSGAPEDAAASGDLDITGDLSLIGAGAAQTIIDGGSIDRVLHVVGPVVVHLEGLTIRGGDSGDDLGGGLRNDGGTLTVEDCSFESNVAVWGGGVFNSSDGTLDISRCSITGNAGGGLLSGGQLTVGNSTIALNTGSSGGGVALIGHRSFFRDTTIASNQASNEGGGVFDDGSQTQFVNCTVTGNSAPDGGGFWFTDGQVLQNTILADNSTDCFGSTLISWGNNLFHAYGNCSVDWLSTDEFAEDAGLGVYADTGEPGGGYVPLLANSPAIDRGSGSACSALDQIGAPRNDGDGDGGTVCDIGAVEYICPDGDVDGFVACGIDCDDGNPSIYPLAPQLCDGVNNDCSDPDWPQVPALEADSDGDGYRTCGELTDCDDASATVFPGATEVCNEIDDDCDGYIDDFDDIEDADADGVPGACDNCPDFANRAQTDLDFDGEGDVCDTNDGLIGIHFRVTTTVEWDPESGFSTWNVYRGLLSDLVATGVYSQPLGSNPAAGALCGLIQTFGSDPQVFEAGEVTFYLVTGVDGGGLESGFGVDGVGTLRPNDNPCAGAKRGGRSSI